MKKLLFLAALVGGGYAMVKKRQQAAAAEAALKGVSEVKELVGELPSRQPGDQRVLELLPEGLRTSPVECLCRHVACPSVKCPLKVYCKRTDI